MNRAEPTEADLALQRELLAVVSRTFALTIPALPSRLERVVGNAYLLCRITDTIEDAAALDADATRAFCERFIAVVEGRENAEAFAREFGRHLAAAATNDERRLIAESPRVLQITATFGDEERAAIADCVAVMGRGMADFGRRRDVTGLADLAEHARYCYVVAGCVGEMLTRLFVAEAPALQPYRSELMRLAISFGQCLQMTNILKDVWEDRARGACWLPRDVFLDEGLDLANATPGDARFVRGYRRLLGLAAAYARDALRYTLLVPAQEHGIRNFCAWSLFMAVLTQRKLLAHPGFSRGADVKISRTAVRAVVAWCRLGVRWDPVLRGGFALLAHRLPAVRRTDLVPSRAPTSHEVLS